MLLRLLLNLSDGGVTLFDPRVDHLALEIGENKAHSILFGSVVVVDAACAALLRRHSLLLLLWLLLEQVDCAVLVVEVLDLRRDVLVVLLERYFHDVDHVLVAQGGHVLVFKHLFCTVLSLLYTGYLSQWDHDEGLLRHALERQIVLVDEQGVLVKHQVPLDQALVLLDEFADRAIDDDLVLLILTLLLASRLAALCLALPVFGVLRCAAALISAWKQINQVVLKLRFVFFCASKAWLIMIHDGFLFLRG